MCFSVLLSSLDNEHILFPFNSPCVVQREFARSVCYSDIKYVYLRSNRHSGKSIGQDWQIGNQSDTKTNEQALHVEVESEAQFELKSEKIY